MIYQPFEQLESLYLESKLITSKNFIGTFFGHMVTISDLGEGPQSWPLPLVTIVKSFSYDIKALKTYIILSKICLIIMFDFVFVIFFLFIHILL